MNKLHKVIIKYIKILKKQVLFILQYSKSLFKSKKQIDDIYIQTTKSKLKQVETLEIELKILLKNNNQLEKEISTMKVSIAEKRKLIEDLQDLVTRKL